MSTKHQSIEELQRQLDAAIYRADSAEFELAALKSSEPVDDYVARRIKEAEHQIARLKSQTAAEIKGLVDQAQALEKLARRDADQAYEEVRREAENRARALIQEAGRRRSLAEQEAEEIRTEAAAVRDRAAADAKRLLDEARESRDAMMERTARLAADAEAEQELMAPEGPDPSVVREAEQESVRILEEARAQAAEKVRRAWEIANERIRVMEQEAEDRVAALNEQARELSRSIDEASRRARLSEQFDQVGAESSPDVPTEQAEEAEQPTQDADEEEQTEARGEGGDFVTTETGIVFPVGAFFKPDLDAGGLSERVARREGSDPDDRDPHEGAGIIFPTPKTAPSEDEDRVDGDAAAELASRVFRRRRMRSDPSEPDFESELLRRARHLRPDEE